MLTVATYKIFENTCPWFSHTNYSSYYENKQTNRNIPAIPMAYLPSIFRIHTSSSSKNISGPSRFSMSLKPLQGTYEEDIYKQASVTSTNVLVTLIHKSELQRKMVIFL